MKQSDSKPVSKHNLCQGKSCSKQRKGEWCFPEELCAMNISQGNGFHCLNKVNGEFISILPFNRKFGLSQNYIL